jgi:hypothetical protein
MCYTYDLDIYKTSYMIFDFENDEIFKKTISAVESIHLLKQPLLAFLLTLLLSSHPLVFGT